MGKNIITKIIIMTTEQIYVQDALQQIASATGDTSPNTVRIPQRMLHNEEDSFQCTEKELMFLRIRTLNNLGVLTVTKLVGENNILVKTIDGQNEDTGEIYIPCTRVAIDLISNDGAATVEGWIYTKPL